MREINYKMSRKSKIKKVIYITLACFAFFILLFILRNYYQKTSNNQKAALKITVEAPVLDTEKKQWKYTTNDNPQYALPTFNDSLWSNIQPNIYTDSVSSEIFGSIIWFRHYFSVDSSLTQKILAFDIMHFGASEIYIDGKLIKRFGKVSGDLEKEKAFIPELPVLFSVADTKKHLLAIRYSNLNASNYLKKYDENTGGINIKLISDAYDGIRAKKQSNALSFLILCLFGFSFTLFVVHFLLYVFYRKQKENLYFSLFMFVFSLVVVKPFMLNAIHVPSIYLFYMYYSNILPLFSMFLLVICMYVLFKPQYQKISFIIGCLLTLLVILSEYIEAFSFLNLSSWFMIILYMGIESIRSVLTGIKRKQEGSKIVGAGVSIFFLIVLGAVLISIITSQIKSEVTLGLSGILIILFMLLMIMSIPLSMSIYLARKFALTNQSLEHRLIEVEQLSEKTLKQEKEKQQLLASQNEYLESQVKERTEEVVKQKEIIEEKHKEITDSIAYAKRLQEAILPSQEFINQQIQQNFVLYKPKDIVAGDFYWAENIGNLFFIAAADSTGHGVPGAMVSVVCSNALNRSVKEFNLTETGKILDKTRELVIETFEKNNTEVKDGMDISLLCIDKQNQKIFWSGANNPLWFIQNTVTSSEVEKSTFSGIDSARQNIELIEIKADKQPIGKSYDIKSFNTHEIEYKVGTSFYLFTDGLADQFGGPKGKKFKYKQFEELLVSINELAMKEQAILINQKFEEWRGILDQVDDLCIIGIRV